MEDSRTDTPRKRKRVLLGKGPFFLILVFIFFLGLLAGFFLTLYSDPFTIKLKESPFGPEMVSRLPKGKSFDCLGELENLPGADRDKYRELLKQHQAGALDKARAAAAALAGAHPRDPLVAGTAAWMHLVDAPGQAADPDMASALLSSAGPAHPEHPWLNYVAGLLHEKSGRSDSALSRYLRCLRFSPQFAYPHAALGRIQLARGEGAHAASSLRKAIGLMITSPESYRSGGATALPPAEAAPFDWLATYYMQAGAVDSARMALEYGFGKGWHTDRMSLVQGWLWEVSGFLPKADSVYLGLLAKDSGNAEYRQARLTLGWKAFRTSAADGKDGKDGKGKDARDPRAAGADAIFALSLLDPLARQNPGNAALWMALGQAYYHRGLFAMATDCFDASLKADPSLPGLAEKREAAYQALVRESAWDQARAAQGGKRKRPDRGPLTEEEQAPVVLPGTIALLGTYSVPWGATPVDVRAAYPAKNFRNMKGGHLLDEFVHDGVHHQYLLAFKDGKLWGVRVFVTDSLGQSGDLFGRIIRTKTKISGEGKGTGEAACPGFLPFQGAIWETDDSFEFMAQFSSKENQIRLARMDRKALPRNRRLCDLVIFLRAETWEGNGPPKEPPPPQRPVRPPPRPVPKAVINPMPPMPAAPPPPPPDAASPSIVVPPEVDPYESAPDVTE